MKKKKREPIYLQYKCKDGSSTVAATASIGLMHWYGRIIPTKPIENPKPFEVYVVRTPVPMPYAPQFLPLVVAGLERTYGKAPEIPAHLFDAAHYEKFPKQLGFHGVEDLLKEGVPEVVEYEQVCLDILHWLKEQGEITKMLLNEPMQPFDW
jgi:hypothetical protein